MIRTFVFTLSLAVALAAASASSAAQTLDGPTAATQYNQAGALYQAGRFGEALMGYEALINDGIANPDLYYNASNAAYRTGDLGRAMLYVERALMLDPSDEDALANRAFLNSVKADQEEMNDQAVHALIVRMYNRIDINTAAWLSVATFALSMLFATVWLFAKHRLRLIMFVGMCLGVSVFAVTTGLFAHKLNYRATVVEAIVMDDEARAYSGPGTENTHIFTIHEGTKVQIERAQGDWRLIRLNSGAGGWLDSGALALVAPLK